MAMKFKALINGERKELPARRFSHYVDNVRFWFAVHPSLSNVGELTVSHWDSGKAVCHVSTTARIHGTGQSEPDLGRAEINKLVGRVGAIKVAKVLRDAERPAHGIVERPCTCHPDDSPPTPCAKQYALTECRAESLGQGPDPQARNPFP